MIEKILWLRKHYHFGPAKIAMYLARYHDVTSSTSGVWRILKRLRMNRLPASQRYRRRVLRWKRYEKQRPGHQLQVNVKFIATSRTMSTVWAEHRLTRRGQTCRATLCWQRFIWGSAAVPGVQQKTAATNARPGDSGRACSRLAGHERCSTRRAPPLCKQGFGVESKLSAELSVNGSRNLTSCRQVKIDQLGVIRFRWRLWGRGRGLGFGADSCRL